MKAKHYPSRSVLFILFMFVNTVVNAQTFFETAKDDGIISFSNRKKLSQIKVSPSSTAASFGYYFIKSPSQSGLIGNLEAKAKPNEQGMAVLVKTGDLQPGLQLNGALGYRLYNAIDKFFSAFDFYIRPSYKLDGYSILDTLRAVSGSEAFYKTNKSSFALNGLMNVLLSPGKTNLYIGVQYGLNWTNNGDDLDDISIQTIHPYPGSATQTFFTDIKQAKSGVLRNVTSHPLKADLIIDPGIKLDNNKEATVRLGFFGYYRTNGYEKKYREGLGICFLNEANPGKIFSSIGYELPTHGPDVKIENRRKDKGMVFVTIGYAIF